MKRGPRGVLFIPLSPRRQRDLVVGHHSSYNNDNHIETLVPWKSQGDLLPILVEQISIFYIFSISENPPQTTFTPAHLKICGFYARLHFIICLESFARLLSHAGIRNVDHVDEQMRYTLTTSRNRILHHLECSEKPISLISKACYLLSENMIVKKCSDMAYLKIWDFHVLPGGIIHESFYFFFYCND